MEKYKNSIRRITIIYILVYFIIVGIYCVTYGSTPTGEWDDYSLPTVSIIKNHRFSITTDDVEAFKEFFPQWSTAIDNYELSGYVAKNGGQMPWYFPTYSIVCIPMILLLRLLELPATYAFIFTNFAFIMVLLLVVYFYLKSSDICKLELIILLSVNPIIFYLTWVSAETFIFAILGIAMVFWYNKWYKRAAFFVSVAGMLNPTIMSIGIIMIIEYLLKIWVSRDKSDNIFYVIKNNIHELIKYAFCYIIGIIPMIYNYYNTGYINLTAARFGATNGRESIIDRFFAYIFDLNYGIFPYYPFILIIGLLLIILAIYNKHWRYIEWFVAFIVNVILYSIMVHINCGMSGIARYNAWGNVVLICAICLYFNEIVKQHIINSSIQIALVVNVILIVIIVYHYGPMGANKTSYLKWTPIATYVIDHYPSLYNPLHSTFNSRTMHLDGGDIYETPIVYSGKDGYVRKILATSNNIEYLTENYAFSNNDGEKWFFNQLSSLTEKEQYISIPKRYEILKCSKYTIGEPIYFYTENYNAEPYVCSGISQCESWGTWTEGNEMVMCFKTNSEYENLHGKIKCNVYNGKQSISIYVNNNVVYSGIAEGQDIEFDFLNPGRNHTIIIKIEMPDAISPAELGESADSRVISLGLQEIVFIGE